MMGKCSILYVAICSCKSSPGIYKKILGFVKGTRDNGFDSKAEIIEPNGIKGYFTFIKKVVFSEEKIIVIRYLPKIGIVIFFLGILLRLRNRNLIIDVPTPMVNVVKEILFFKIKKININKIIHILIIYFQSFVPFLSAKKVIQYAEESLFFSCFVKKRSILLGNGIDTESIPLITSRPKWPSDTLYLIAVGSPSIWNGWDKIIKVMKQLRDESFSDFRIKLTIVGGKGPEYEKLQNLTNDYSLSENISFLGLLTGDELYAEYAKAHFGIGSFGWNRIGAKIASPIKNREYVAAGLPFIYATKDTDFDNKNNISFIVSDKEESDDLLKFIKRIKTINIASPIECRNFALNKLDFKNKTKLIFDNLVKNSTMPTPWHYNGK